ncbi:hypothetical protein TBLA_0A08950 [Henningerozyma blattae CBS 6284]|uniref:Mannosyl-oligosaccharide glucosidase n=1 Tax=Henningerozyma blattae (strain ATCC 34711 / CBS 6284 / DSM 70876 / NBRC 10599 / NRRL Y-10934 / UCD 77-7) TaxID=1071380 RepID=I2GX32_HENB6|nr:hypothetical protein TBLA_0A08950 [Tetrapisispora blattae CBS 6284]CCH58684.1 hypothetical protein TBLA_0A08950 [Tetrapisispora blattae CBS 6284]
MLRIYSLLYFLLTTLSICHAEKGANKDLSFYEYTEKSLLWAPYRSNCYLGVRPRNIDQSPLVVGLMWFDSSVNDGLNRLRHFVDQNDGVKQYTWEVYDPRLGGKEVIIDEENNLNLTLYFVKSQDGENWSIRVHGVPIDTSRKHTASVVLYLSQNGENDGESQLIRLGNGNDIEFVGHSKEMGKYNIKLFDNYGKYAEAANFENLDNPEIYEGLDCSKTAHVSLHVPDEETWKARDIFQSILSDSATSAAQALQGEVNPDFLPSLLTVRNIFQFQPGNFHFIQKTFDMSNPEGFEFDVVYNAAKSPNKLRKSNRVTNLITSTLNEIQARFNRHFDLKGQDEEHRVFALQTLSNLLGGIGYFHGTQIVDRVTEFNDETFEPTTFSHAKEESPLSLFTSVPSRGFFPRGFYWDEGFQLLQIMEYDFDLAFEIITSWFDLIEDDSGWVAREVILGAEARSRVPEEFTVQSPNVANPPTLLMTFSEMLSRAIDYQNSVNFNQDKESNDNQEKTLREDTNQLEQNSKLLVKYAKRIYPKLLKHYEWFTTSQKGLTEDYVEVFEEEGILSKVHLDHVYRWLGRTVTHCLPSGLDDYPRAQPPDAAELNVDTLAWVGVMTRSMKQIAHVLGAEDDEKRYLKIEKDIIQNLDNIHWSDKDKCYCDVTLDDYEDERQFVCHEGYISLLPFALKLIPKDSIHLDSIIELMSNEEKLFTDYGLVSLSKQDEYHGKGENYWRGPIWVNINYICLDALRFYYPEVITNDSKGNSKAMKLYNELKNNLIDNIFENWQETGYVYENYNQNDGRGSGAKQFTGWTALVVNMLGRM